MADMIAKLQKKMRKTYLKMLIKSANGKINKAKELERKLVLLELELKKVQ